MNQALAGLSSWSPGSISGQSRWDLWVDRFADFIRDFIRELLVVSVSVSFHQCSIRTHSPIPDAIQILAAENVVK